MREESWVKLFTSINRLLKKLADAVSLWTAGQHSVPTQNQSTAKSAEELFKPVSVPDAVAELSAPTGDDSLDHVHEMTIDCLQRGYLRAVRDSGNKLRFAITPSGKEYVQRMLGRDN